MTPEPGFLGRESAFNPPLRVADFRATRKSDPDRGPEVRINGDEARLRLLSDGELAYVAGPRRRELAVVRVDDAVGRGDAIVRDIAGIAPSEIITIRKPDLDRRPGPGRLA